MITIRLPAPPAIIFHYLKLSATTPSSGNSINRIKGVNISIVSPNSHLNLYTILYFSLMKLIQWLQRMDWILGYEKHMRIKVNASLYVTVTYNV